MTLEEALELQRMARQKVMFSDATVHAVIDDLVRVHQMNRALADELRLRATLGPERWHPIGLPIGTCNWCTQPLPCRCAETA